MTSVQIPSPKIIEPTEWAGSTHAQCDILFDKANQTTLAKPESLEGLHAVAPTSNLNRDDKTPQEISTLANPVKPAGYRYVEGPEVSINSVSVKIKEENPYNIPPGEYILINKANRTPMKEKGKKETYEFPGRVWQENGDEAMQNELDRQKTLLVQELGMTPEEANQVKAQPLINNLAPAAGNSSMIQRVNAMEIPQTHITKLISKFGGSYDKENGVVTISRKCDGGIIEGMELIPRKKALEYLKQKAKDGYAIASNTFAGLLLAP
mgnify:CR=1 FL=1